MSDRVSILSQGVKKNWLSAEDIILGGPSFSTDFLNNSSTQSILSSLISQGILIIQIFLHYKVVMVDY